MSETGKRRRGTALEQALLDASWQELEEAGYARFTMDAVATRAGTSRPVLYRRWGDRLELLRATIVHVLERNRVPAPEDTGSLRGDLLALMQEISRTRTEFVTVLSVHLAGYFEETGTGLADLRDVIRYGRPHALDIVYGRAAARGEIDLDRLSPRVRELPFTLLRLELLTTLQPVPDETLADIVDTIVLPLLRPTGGS
ncbi:TetR/AcrR family transcriptional regulator [Micromonospora sp. WMMD987]|uniref:TetR/AcrR family transcriptional regulator n=1 Tax=Micromonospora TaxID=1873 RepID=UPI00249CBD56|nr:TetR/AcrR family transcriptional regulator [Micromonospora sp. WMMD987]WFE93445.1 TetR/AcrR family transcriptional regulator [Micromonospora sp. WMMD987]